MSAIVISNGIIRTDAWSDPVEALVVDGGVVTYAGSLDGAHSSAGRSARHVDLDGATVVPGLVESHVHLVFAGLTDSWTDCRSPLNTSIGDLQAALRSDLKDLTNGRWLRGWGYDDTLLAESRHPTRDDLDAVSADVPIVMSHISGHFAVANSKALEIAQIHDDSPDPAEGRYVHDRDGRLTGLMWEMGAVHKVLGAIPGVTDQEVRDAATRSLKLAASRGMTAVHDLGIGTAAGELELDAWHRLAADGSIPIRVAGYLRSDFLGTRPQDDPLLFKRPEDGNFRLAGAKFWSDGSIQGLSGALKQPYSCTDSDCGELLFSPEDLHRQLAAVDAVGGQCAVHANGDLAISTVAGAYAAIHEKTGRSDPRHRVEHLQMASTDDIASLVNSGSVASIFANHVYYWGDRHRDRFIGADRAARIDPTGDAESAGLHFGMHSDCPITPMDVLATFRTSITRQTSGGSVLGEDQRIGRRAALHALTADSAYLVHDENRRGTLAPDMDADLTVLDADVVGLPIDETQDARAVATMVAGEFVFEDAGF